MIHTKAGQDAREQRASKPTCAEFLADENTRALYLADIRKSESLPGLVGYVTSMRDFNRDLGTHGIGAMDGKPWDCPQRVEHREMERICTLLIGVLT